MSIEDYKKLLARQNRGKSAASEHDLQKQCIDWFRMIYPQYARLLLAIPNGARRTLWEQRIAKEEGIQAGTPDLFLAIPRKKSHGLWIEMKNGKAGRVSDKQDDMIKRLWEQGYECRIARSMEDFMQIINEYLA